MELFKLVGSIFVDNEKANDSLAKTDKKASSVGETMSKVCKGAAKAGAAIGASAVAIGTAVVGMASSSAKAMDEVDKGSQRMKISAESYQELAHAAELSGVEMGSLEKAAKKLEGTGLNLDDALDQIYALESAEERSAKAAELFGDSVAYTLTPMLNASGDEMKAMRKEAKDLGLVFAGEDVKAGAKMNDMLTNLSKSFSSLVTGLGNKVMPLVMQFAEKIMDFLPRIEAMFDSLQPVIDMVFETLLPPLLQLIDNLFPVLEQLIQTLIPPLTQLMEGIMPILVTLAENLGTFLAPILEMLAPLLDLVIAILNPLLNIINGALGPIIQLISGGLTVALRALQPVIEFVTNLFTGAWEGIRNSWAKAGGFFSAIWEKIKLAFAGVKTFFTNLFEGVKTVLKSVLNGTIWILNKYIDGVNILLIPLRAIILAVGKLFGASWTMDDVRIPHIPALAKGGNITEEGSAVVGEAGPELVELNKGAKVTPLNNGTLEDIENRLNELVALFQKFTGMGVYIDGGALVGQIAPGMDSELGRIAARKGRGLL